MELLNGPKLVTGAQTFVTTKYSDPVDVTGVSVLAVEVVNDVNTPSPETFLSGAARDTLTFPTKAGSTGGDYFVVKDTAGLSWAAALDKAGTDPEPTGAVWTAIAAGRKVNVDISGATTAAEVAALVETALNALTNFTTTFLTDDTAANGTMKVTLLAAGAVGAPERHNADDSGNGSMTVAATYAGAAGTIDLTADTITIVAHGLLTGNKGQVSTTGTLPTGLSASTDYFVIVVDADTIQLATSLANAQAGTAIDLSAIGYGTQTYTSTAIAGATATLQKSLGTPGVESEWVWFDEGSAQNITADGSLYFEKVNPSGNFYRIAFAITAGQLSSYERWLGKRIT